MSTSARAPGASRADRDYQSWIEREEPALWADGPKADGQSISDGPLISLVLPCVDPSGPYLAESVESVLQQSYSRWQLCLSCGSRDPVVDGLVRNLAERDGRATYVPAPPEAGEAALMHLAADLADGEWVGFIGQSGRLSSRALAEVVRVVNGPNPPDVLYSDEDSLTVGGARRRPFFKPDWSPDLFLGVDYISRFVVLRRSLLEEGGGLRPTFDGAALYDLLLRVSERTDRIAHLPRVLYHRRIEDLETSADTGAQALESRREVLCKAMERRQIEADIVEAPDQPGGIRLRYRLPSGVPKVSIIIPFRDKVALLEQCLGSILSKSSYENFEVILVSNDSTDPATEEYLANLRDDRCAVYRWNNPFNYAALNNFAARQASGDYLILLNNDTEVLTTTWIEELVAVAAQPGVGAVGALLLYPNTKIQHAGVVVGMTGLAGHVFRHLRPDDLTPFGRPDWPRNYLAVTGACLAVSSATYREVGGLDENFAVAGNDVDFCLRLHDRGYRNVYWPFARLVHHESATVGGYDTGVRSDFERCRKSYGPYLGGRDPFFNVNMDMSDERISLAFPHGGSLRQSMRRAPKRLELSARRLGRAYRNQGLVGVVRKAWRRGISAG